MLHNHRVPSRRTGRRGVAAFELLLLLPILLLLLAGMVGVADLLIAEQRLDEAAARAGRVAAMGGSREQVEEAIVAVLGPDRAQHATISITPVPGATGSSDELPLVKDEQKNYAISPHDNSGLAGYDDPNYPGVTTPDRKCRHLELVEVRIEIDLRHAAATSLVPLSRDEKLVGRTVVNRHTAAPATSWSVGR